MSEGGRGGGGFLKALARRRPSWRVGRPARRRDMEARIRTGGAVELDMRQAPRTRAMAMEAAAAAPQETLHKQS